MAPVLNTLKLQQTLLTGEIPLSYCSLHNLTTLDIGNRAADERLISGSIPSCLPTSLKHLYELRSEHR